MPATNNHWPLAVLISAYILWFSFLSFKMYDGYGYPPFDLAIFDQGLWLLSHFHAPFVTVMGRNLFGDHTSFILLPLVPFYRLVPEPQGILVLQTAILGGTAFPIYLLARKLIHNTAIATLLAASYLLNPALQNGNMDQFHPEAFQVLIISIAICAAIQSKPVLLGIMVALALLVKEDASVLVIPLGLWVLWRRNASWGLRIIAASVAWAVVANEWIIPSILGTNAYYAYRIPFGGLGNFVSTTFHSPGRLLSYLRSTGQPFYVWQMGFSFGWVFLLSPEIAAVGLLSLAENVLSADPYMHQILYHYSLPLVAVIAIGSVFAIAAQRSRTRRNIGVSAIVLSSLCSCIIWGLAPFSRDAYYPSAWTLNTGTIEAASYLEELLPPTAVVCAWYPFVAHIDHRTAVYVWPAPFSAVNFGLTADNGAPLPIARDVQYLLLPIHLGSTDFAYVFSTIAGQFELLKSRDNVGLYKRVAA